MAGDARGFTLMELLIALSIMAIITALTVPSFATMLAERRVSASAKAYAAALRKAQAEAIARNRNIEVLFTAAEPTPATVASATATTAAAGGRWMVRRVGADTVADFVEGHALVDVTPTVTIDAPATVLGFTPLGRPVDLSSGTAAPLAGNVVVRFTDSTSARRICTFLTTGGAIRTCDPLRASGDAAACQPQLAPGDC
ncbi:MAG: Tfp pilus assembly protein FimT/FimU [Lautropia sp.]